MKKDCASVITEVRVKLVDDGNPKPGGAGKGGGDASANDKLLAFCTITLDKSFVIRDLKIIDSHKGPFVAMPSRKLADKCPHCSSKNHLRARHCNDCGGRLDPTRAAKDDRGRPKLHADIAHPINASTRELLQRAVLEAFKDEHSRSQVDGYRPPRIDLDEDY